MKARAFWPIAFPLLQAVAQIPVAIFLTWYGLSMRRFTFNRIVSGISSAIPYPLRLGGFFSINRFCIVVDSSFHLTEHVAVLNEIVWRNVSTDTWVAFKVFGVVPLTIVFGALQVPLLKR